MAEPTVLDVEATDIHAEGARLRKAGPVALIELPGGVRAWAVARLDVLRTLLADPRVSKDPRQHWAAWRRGEISDRWPLYLWVALENMFTAHGAEHRRLRGLLAAAFTARRTAELRPRIEQIAGRLLDDIAARPDGEPVDLRAAYANPLPIEVITSLFGVPDDQQDEVRQTVAVVLDSTAPAEVALANGRRISELVADMVARKRQAPGDDLTTSLIAVRDEHGDRLTETELIDTLSLLVASGYEATANLIDHAIVALLSHPDQLDRVRAGEPTWPDVIEESLRWQPPSTYVPLRYAVEDIHLDGVTIPKGDAILAAYAAAGRDRLAHGDTADEFDTTRQDKHHLSFGHGMHYCIGAPLARLEAEIALAALFTRFPGMTLAAPPSTLPVRRSLFSNGHTTIPAFRTARAGAGHPLRAVPAPG
ncbi:MAG: cytochrome P450 family protein [Stackebrandtia sp.]